TWTNNQFPKQTEVRPWRGTLLLYQKSLSENMLLGVGPNRFYVLWNKDKSPEVNTTPFWNIDFNNSVGTIPTSMTTTGVLGTISWGLFILVLLWYVIRVLFKKDQNDSAA